MMKYIIGLSLVLTVGCTSKDAPKAESNPTVKDANEKVVAAYEFLENGQVFDSEKMFKEVIAEAQKNKDVYLEAHALTGLGDIYSYDSQTSPDGRAPERKLDYKLAAQTYEQAASKLMEIKYTKHAAITYYGAAETYSKANDHEKSCDLRVKSSEVYNIESKKTEDQLNSDVVEEMERIFKPYKQANYKTDCMKLAKATVEMADKDVAPKKKK